jgi:hypothetical protein
VNISAVAAIIAFLASVVLSQKIAVNAGSRLDDEMKLKLIDVFPKRNVNYTILVFGMVVAFLLGLYLFLNTRGSSRSFTQWPSRSTYLQSYF